jgi:hypothetical protein
VIWGWERVWERVRRDWIAWRVCAREVEVEEESWEIRNRWAEYVVAGGMEGWEGEGEEMRRRRRERLYLKLCCQRERCAERRVRCAW